MTLHADTDASPQPPPNGESLDAGTGGHQPPGLFGVVALPGLAVWRRWPVAASLLFAAGVTAPFYATILLVQNRRDLVGLLSRPNVLRGLALVAVAGIASRIVAVWLTADRLEDIEEQRRMRVWGSLAVMVLAAPTALGVLRMEQARSVVTEVFQQSPTAGVVTLPETVSDPYEGEFETVLLLGSDEGDDRVGIRTDTMLLAIIHKASGRASLVSVPRNLVSAKFPPGSPLAELYPNGFDDMLNAVYITVENDEELVDAYETPEAKAGIRALMETISYTMGIPIDDYVLVNSCAFVGVVDAIGGIIIDIDKELPMPAKMRCSNYRLTPTIGPGETYMDGTKALGYVRSRMADSDYDRMERQRILLETIASEIGFDDILEQFGDLTKAMKDNVQTSMTLEEARTMLSIMQNGDGTLGSVGIAPPLFHPSEPDFDLLQAIVHDIRRSLAEGTPLTIAATTTTTVG